MASNVCYIASKPGHTEDRAQNTMPLQLLLRLGDLQSARSLVDTLLEAGPPTNVTGGPVGKLPACSVASALVLQSYVALYQGEKERTGTEDAAAGTHMPDAATIKRLLLEARWAAAGSLRELQGHPFSAVMRDGSGSREQAVAHTLLAQSELARGRPEKAADGLGKALSVWEHMAPPDLIAQYVDVRTAQAGREHMSPEYGKAMLAGAVLAEPWNSSYWTRLHAVGSSAAAGTSAS